MPGMYMVKLTVGDEDYFQELRVLVDPDQPDMDVARINRQELLELLYRDHEEEGIDD